MIFCDNNNCNWKVKLMKISKVPNMLAEDELMLLRPQRHRTARDASAAAVTAAANHRCRRDYCRQPPLPPRLLPLFSLSAVTVKQNQRFKVDQRDKNVIIHISETYCD